MGNRAVDVEHARAVLDRFNRRFDEAHAKAAPSKRWVRRALHGRGAARCPVRLKRMPPEIPLANLVAMFEACHGD